jgi:CHAT domain-containing protein/tetratricopeptide (TPR) repeat protein
LALSVALMMLPNARVLWLSAFLLLAPGCRTEESTPEAAALAALGDYRPCLARLTTELGYVPCNAEPLAHATKCSGELPGLVPLRRWHCSPRPLPRSKAFNILAKVGTQTFADIAKEEATAPALLHAATLQILWQGDERTVERAGAWLRQGLASAPDRQPFLADLGALHLLLAERNGQTNALLRAIEYLEQALEEQPDAAGPRFNLALALSQLGLFGSAREEWTRFLTLEPQGPWSTEARSWLSSLPPDDGELLKKKIAGRLSAAVAGRHREVMLTTARLNRQLTREWIENDLLPRWAEARLADDEEMAARTLQGAMQLTSDLAIATGDRLLAEAVAVISGATASQQLQLAQAHRELGEGLRLLYRDWTPESAYENFRQAEREFGRGHSPFILWARFYCALALNYRQRFAEAEAELAALTRDVDAARYPALMGRIHWIRGLATSAQDKVEESNAHYRAAAVIFCRLGEPQNLAATQGLLAAGMSKLGHYEAGWMLTRSALARRGSIFQLLRLQAILQDAFNNAHRQGLLRAGQHFADEWVAVAEREGSPETLHNALMRRAALRQALGHSSGARADLDRAVRALRPLTSPELRNRAEADRALELARGLLRTDPVAAAELLTQAIATYRASGNLQKLPQAYGLRSQAFLAQQQVDPAERDLIAETRLLEITLFATGAGPLRQDRIAVLQDSFDRMVEFQATVRRDADAAFRFAEQKRHWALWEWERMAASGKGNSPLFADPLATVSLADLQALHGSDTAILAYHVLPDRVLLWASGPGGSTVATAAINHETLRSRLSALLSAARRRNGAALRPPAEALHRVLIAPIAASITGASRLVIVPDRLLQELPFGLLRDPPTGRYLYESHALVFSPSATAYARLDRMERGPGATSHRLLAVAGTRGERPTLPALPEAAEEAAAVAAQWQGGQALSFREPAALRQQLVLADIFHFAGHALAGPGSLRLVFHDDATQPLQLTAPDILSEGFPHLRLVTLSGCETVDVGMASQVGSSSAGFVRSFLAAGVPTVVASFLELDDRQARDVFTAFHRRLAQGEDAAQALRQACLKQPLESQDESAVLCGSLAVFGVSLPFGGDN